MSTAADMRGGGGERATWLTCGVPERIVVEKGGNKGEAMVRAVPGAREGVVFFSATVVVRRGKSSKRPDNGCRRLQGAIVDNDGPRFTRLL